MSNPRLPANRQIGYRPPEYHKPEQKAIKDEVIKEPPTPKAEKEVSGKKNDKIVSWLNDHKELFKINGLCEKIGYDTSNFNKQLKAGKLPESLLNKIEPIIKKYGYE